MVVHSNGMNMKREETQKLCVTTFGSFILYVGVQRTILLRTSLILACSLLFCAT